MDENRIDQIRRRAEQGSKYCGSGDVVTNGELLALLPKKEDEVHNSRWKGIQSSVTLLEFLEKNPSFYLHDTGDRESRYVIRDENGEFINSVDGRSVRAVLHKLGTWKASNKYRPRRVVSFTNSDGKNMKSLENIGTRELRRKAAEIAAGLIEAMDHSEFFGEALFDEALAVPSGQLLRKLDDAKAHVIAKLRGEQCSD